MLHRRGSSGPPKWPVGQRADHMLLARTYVTHQRDLLLRSAYNTLSSHQRRVNFGLAGNLSSADLNQLHLYISALNEVTRQDGFPYEVQWPPTPNCLRSSVIE